MLEQHRGIDWINLVVLPTRSEFQISRNLQPTSPRCSIVESRSKGSFVILTLTSFKIFHPHIRLYVN